jgi:hypothetical protein
MEQKKSKIFNSKNTKSIEEYCKLNNIDDVDEFVHQCFKIGYDVKKYGFLGKTLNEGEKDLRDSRKTCGIEEKREGIEVIREKRAEKEVIQTVEVIKEVEKIVEVEVIKYVDREIIKEVPVEKIITITNDFEPVIKEVIIEKIVEVENTDKLKMLSETLLKLRKDLSLKDKRIEELESINKQLESIKVSQGAVYLKGSNITQRL